MYTIEERLHYKKFVTATRAKKEPIYNWYAFPHSYSPELVHEMLSEFNATKDSLIYDPFVGAGTTLLACREKQIPAWGIDQLPFSVFVSNTKVQCYLAKELNEVLDTFTTNHELCDQFGDLPIVEKAFSAIVKRAINSIYAWVCRIPNQNHSDFFLLSLLSLLEEFSLTVKSGGWLRLVDKDVCPENVIRAFLARSHVMINDAANSKNHDHPESWYALLGDARDTSVILKQPDFVITSPPYLNRHDYTRIFSLEMALHFVKSNQDLIDIRKKSMRSHVEAKPLPTMNSLNYMPPDDLLMTLAELEPRLSQHDKKRITSMISGYFEDMFLVLDSISQGIAKAGKIAFVVSNVRFSGVTIRVDEILAQIGEQVGLTPCKIVVVRYRGNSAQQMGRYGREPVRESIVIWNKSL